MALEGLSILQKGAGDIADVRMKKRERELVEAKYRDDVAEAQRKRAAQEEIGAAFSKTPQGRTGLGQVQSLGLSSGELTTAGAVDPWLKMSKEQQTFWMVNEANRLKDPVLRDAATKAMSAMDQVNFAQAFFSTKGRILAENAYKPKDEDGDADKKFQKPIAIRTQTVLSTMENQYPDGIMTIPAGKILGVKTDLQIDLKDKRGIIPQIQDLQTDRWLAGKFGRSPQLTVEQGNILNQYILNNLQSTMKDAIKSDNALYRNSAAESYLDRDASIISQRVYLGGTYKTFYKENEKGNSTLIPDIAVEGVPKSFVDQELHPSGTLIPQDTTTNPVPQVQQSTVPEARTYDKSDLNEMRSIIAPESKPQASLVDTVDEKTKKANAQNNLIKANVMAKAAEKRLSNMKEKKAEKVEKLEKQIAATERSIKEAQASNSAFLVNMHKQNLVQLKKELSVAKG